MGTEWTIRGQGRNAYIEAFCPACGNQVIVEKPALNAGLLHCGRRERVPEKIYERFCELRDLNGKPRIPPKPFRVRWF